MSRIWFGNVTNRIMEHCKQPVPEVGMGATRLMWSDREPYEVVAVKDERHIQVRALDYKRIDNNGMSEAQDYEYSSNERNMVVNLFLTKKGVWRERMPDRSLGCDSYVIGYAERYYDFSF